MFNGEVGAVGDDHAALEERTPRVRAAQAALAESVACPVHVARLVGGLHGRDHTELREAWDVVVVEDLRMLHAKAVVSRGCGLEGRLVRVEHEPVAAVSDRVRVDLKARAQRARRNVEYVRGGGDEQAGGLGVVRVGLEQRRAARAERTVLIELHRAHPEHPVVEAALRTAFEPGIDRRRVVGDHRVHPDVERTLATEFLVELEHLRRGAGVVHTGEAPPMHLGDRELDRVLHLRASLRGDRAIDHPLRVVDEDTGRVALCIAFDRAAAGVRARLGDTGLLQRERIHEAGMPVHAFEEDGVVRNGAGERLVRGPACVAPVVLVPTAADDPLALWRVAGALDHPGDDLFV